MTMEKNSTVECTKEHSMTVAAEKSQGLWDVISKDTDPETSSSDEEGNTGSNKIFNDSNVQDPDRPAVGSRLSGFKEQMREGLTQMLDKSEDSPEQMIAAAKEDETQGLTISEVEKEALRPSTISVSILKQTRDSKWGIRIAQDEEEQDTVVVKELFDHGLLKGAPFKENDILRTVNNHKCITSEHTIQQLVEFEGGTQVTLTVDTPNGNPQLVQAMVRKPSEDALLGIGIHNGVRSGQKLLQINFLDPAGFLGRSALSKGDLVLSINDIPCSQMEAEAAAQLIKTSPDTVTIAALRPNDTGGENRSQRWMKHARKAGVAIGGGAMVGVGLIFIPTLPPPFGEVLIVGGVSVLGTEFDAPKRVVKSARDKLEHAVGRGETTSAKNRKDRVDNKSPDDSKEEGADLSSPGACKLEQEVMPASDIETPAIDDLASQRKTMNDRLRNFGRTVVLPFLDQVVGDRNPEENDTEARVVFPVASEPADGTETGNGNS